MYIRKKPQIECSGLANAWDSHAAIRDYLRAGEGSNVLFPDTTQICVRACSVPHIYGIMYEILVPGHPQPSVGPLRDQLTRLYKKAGRTSDVEKTIIDDSWYTRKFFSIIKLKARKRLVSTAPRQALNKE